MTFADWHELTPAAAARRVHQQLAALPAAQQRACVAQLPSERALAERFEAADRNAPPA